MHVLTYMYNCTYLFIIDPDNIFQVQWNTAAVLSLIINNWKIFCNSELAWTEIEPATTYSIA